MSDLAFVSDAELESLYSPEDHDRIAALLHVQSDQGRAELKERVFRVARSYDTGFLEPKHRPPDRETRKSLKTIRKRAAQLAFAIQDASSWAKSDVGTALSKARKERKLSTGEPVLPYGHGASNEWMFAKESLAQFLREIGSLHKGLGGLMETLGRGGRPERPERFSIGALKELWIEYRKKEPTVSTKNKKFTGPFVELCEIALGPIAKRHGEDPDFGSHAHNLLYR